ncbi:ImmA/IrrE family metallo-endopeptidase [Yersinia enterocolitica]
MHNNDDDFKVLPQSGSKIEDVILNFDKLLKSKNLKRILSDKPSNEGDSGFLYKLALNISNNSKKLYRKRDDANFDIINTWFSIIENKAINYRFNSDFKKNGSISFDDLSNIAKLSLDESSIHWIDDFLLNNYGVILIIERAFTGMKLDGCSFCLLDGTPVVALSLRYSRYDYFWFTLMHELSHVCLHYEQLTTPILDDLDITCDSEIEVEANRVAADSLIPRKYARTVYRLKDSPSDLLSVSNSLNLHPIIVAGAIRNKFKNYYIFSELVNSINIRKELGIDD